MGKSKDSPKPRGQASLMIAVMMSSFLIFFAFVVNTGMLVHAKINLQNAADLAAYAGAATQARHMNNISFLNYEMRRQYKKFLFRYYVVGNMFQDSFPVSGLRGRLWSPNMVNHYDVPTVCLIFDRNDNFCRLFSQGKLAIPPVSLLDQISQTLRAQYTQIERIRQDNCARIGANNIQVLVSWLYNTDPEYRAFQTSPPPWMDGKMIQILRSIAGGLGLVPEELILRQRIETLKKYVNAPANTGVTKESAESLKAGSNLEQPMNERTVNAFFTAYQTLGPNVYNDPQAIVMDELLPTKLLETETISTSFMTFAVDFVTAAANPTDFEKDCNARLSPIRVDEVPVGVKKKPDVVTYYALKLSAKARVMFNPFGRDLTLTAFAAAQPFGSRIGPNLKDEDFTQRLTPGIDFGNIMFGGNSGSVVIPNLPITDGDLGGTATSPSASWGWNSPTVMMEMYKQLALSKSSNVAAAISGADLERAFHAGMAPNPAERGLYNFPLSSETLGQEGVQEKDVFANEDFFEGSSMRFWAPVSQAASASGFRDQIASDLTSMFDAAQRYNATVITQADPKESPTRLNLSALVGPMTQGLANYANLLQQGRGDNGEGYRVAVLQEPFGTQAGGTARLPASLRLTGAQSLTSWSPPYLMLSSGRSAGPSRVGYSIKFVSFQSLINGEIAPLGDAGSMGNALNDSLLQNIGSALTH